jgi:hypothetical protein
VWAGGGMHLEAGFDWSVMCRLLALFGSGATSDMSPLSGANRKWDFGATKTVVDPIQKSALSASLHVRQPNLL